MKILTIEENKFTIDGRSFSIDSKKMLQRLKSSVVIDVLPPDTIWVSPKRNSIIVQRPPEYRTVCIRDGGTPECFCTEENACGICMGEYDDSIESHYGDADGWDIYRLPMPWVSYIFAVSNFNVTLLKVFANSTPLEDTKQLLGFLPLPNIYEGGGLCAGSAPLEASRRHQSVSQAVGEVLESFWGSAFNSDIRNDENSEVFYVLSQKGASLDKPIHDQYLVWERLDIKEALQLPWESDAECEFKYEVEELLFREHSVISSGANHGNLLFSTLRQNCLLSRF